MNKLHNAVINPVWLWWITLFMPCCTVFANILLRIFLSLFMRILIYSFPFITVYLVLVSGQYWLHTMNWEVFLLFLFSGKGCVKLVWILEVSYNYPQKTSVPVYLFWKLQIKFLQLHSIQIIYFIWGQLS